jgi:phospholipid/cholesterol/gamma-HCH transport system substrate-binding protein
METRANYALIGAFALLGLIAMAAFSVWIAQVQFNREYAIYDVVFEGPVNGLSESGEVRFNGIKIGEVTDLFLDENVPTTVIARVRVIANTPIRQDTAVTLEFQGLTGVTFVQMRGGSPDAPLLNTVPGGPPARIFASRTQLEQLFTSGQDVVAGVNTAINRVNSFLNEDNIAAFNTILTNVARLSESLGGDGASLAGVSDTLASMAQAADALTVAANEWAELARNADARLSKLSEDADKTLGNANRVLASLETALVGTSEGVNGQLTALAGPLREMVDEIRLATQDVRGLTARADSLLREVERNPGGFIVGDEKPKAESSR